MDLKTLTTLSAIWGSNNVKMFYFSLLIEINH